MFCFSFFSRRDFHHLIGFHLAIPPDRLRCPRCFLVRHCEAPAWLGRAMPGRWNEGSAWIERGGSGWETIHCGSPPSLLFFFSSFHSLVSFCLLRGACPRLVCFLGPSGVGFRVTELVGTLVYLLSFVTGRAPGLPIRFWS